MSSFVVPAASYEAINAYRRLQYSMDKTDPQLAIMEIRTFLKIFPDMPLACNDLGVLYAQSGDKLRALACYEKANRLQPNTPVTVKNLAEFYFVELGWADDAIFLLTELLKSTPDDPELLLLLATISIKVGQNNEARTFYGKVLELDPGNRDASEGLRQLDGDIPLAEFSPPAKPVFTPPVQPVAAPAATAATGSSLDDVLARLRANINAPQAPKPTTVTAIRPTTADNEQLYRDACSAAAAGNSGEAINLLEQLLRDNPTHPLAHNDLGVLYSQAGNLQLACNHHELAVRYQPDNPVFRKNLAALYYTHCGRTDEAIAIYTELLRQYPSDIELLTALAIISNNNNLKEQARTFIRRVLDFEPWNSEARQFLAGL